MQLKPQLATAHYNLAHAHAEKGVIDDAIRCYQSQLFYVDYEDFQSQTFDGTNLRVTNACNSAWGSLPSAW